MKARVDASLVGALGVFSLVLVLLIAGGTAVRGFVADAFAQADQLRATRALANHALAFQLDAGTGVRGYAATRDAVFLEPFAGTRSNVEAALQQLARRLERNGSTAELQAATSAAATSSEWFAGVAAPIIATHGGNAWLIQLHGKVLMDRFRADIDRIEAGLDEGEHNVSARTAQAIDRINFLIAGAVAVALIIAALLLVVRARSAAQTERERRRAEKEGRELAVVRAAYVAEKRIADRLQDAFAQRPLPILPTLRLSATYIPASEEARVGGDWYDALELPGDRVLFAIGDVTGHGIEAAVTMNRARQSVIGSALLGVDPALVLQRANADLCRQNTPLVTAIAGYADAQTFEFVYAIAGHPPPVLLEPGRPARLLHCGSLPLGAIADTEYRTYRVQTVPGAVLVLYTDGAVEHSRDVLEGEAILLRAAAGATTHAPGESAAFIRDAIFGDRSVGDDVAILTISFAADVPEGGTISADRASEDACARLTRRLRSSMQNDSPSVAA